MGKRQQQQQQLNKSKSQDPPYKFPTNFLGLATRQIPYAPRTTTLLPGQIITISKFLSVELCNELITSFEKSLKFITTPLIKSKDYAARVNDRAMVLDNEASLLLFQYLYKALTYKDPYDDDDQEDSEVEQDKVEFANSIGLNPNIRIYRYLLDKQHFFNKHYDEEVITEVANNGNKKGITKWTVLIYLTGDDDLVGGDTVFYKDDGGEEIRVHPGVGMVLLHKHGDDCLLHELESVTKGVKWVLRSDLVYSL